ncbi:hypothetical protein NJ76_30325 [Rhodococcus sp. IITR03]|nr:hypothetical protein NJ76_30325 [Rhodococcus sp. IITR03]
MVLGACEEAGHRIAGTVTDLATTTERVAEGAGVAVGASGAGTVAPVVDDDGRCGTDRATRRIKVHC